jgi:hypothetical protein
MIEESKFNELMELLDSAYKNNDVSEVNRINNLIMNGLEVQASESSLDYEFIESIKGKKIYEGIKDVLKKDISRNDMLKVLSSIVTHLIIESKVRNRNIQDYPIKLFLSMIERIVNDEGKIEDAKKFIHNKYGHFI